MLNVIIIDDEPKNRRILKGLLDEFCPQAQVIGEATGVEEAVAVINKMKPDIIFLDIEMPFGNGFDLLDKLMPVDFEIIFVTAFEEYTLKALRYSALDYLLKPVDIEELQTAIRKAASRINLKTINFQLNNLLRNVQGGPAAVPKVGISTSGGLIFIFMNDIVRCEAKGNYTQVFTLDKQKYLSTRSIKEYEEMLPRNQFFRIHHSHLVNLNHIKKYNKGRGGVVEMIDGAMIEVAIRKKNEFLSLFGFK